MGSRPPEGFSFMGGKRDDITVTVAQIFADTGANDKLRSLAARDMYFPEKKHVYKNVVNEEHKLEGIKED